MGNGPENESRAGLRGQGQRARPRLRRCAAVRRRGRGRDRDPRGDGGRAAPPREIDDEIIAPALWLVGELWERGEISVADEHVATEISIRVLALQREAQRVAQARGDSPGHARRAAGEQHVVALRMVDNLLRDAGYDVVMLGADVPADALAAAASRRRPARGLPDLDDARRGGPRC